MILFDFACFWHKMEDIISLHQWILMKNTVLETLWVALFMIKISPQNLWNFIAKFGSKVEICWISAGYTMNSRITLKFQVIFWDMYYFSERQRCRLPINPKSFMKQDFVKKICEEWSFKRSRDCLLKRGFSKTASTIFLKIPILECRKCPLKPHTQFLCWVQFHKFIWNFIFWKIFIAEIWNLWAKIWMLLMEIKTKNNEKFF